MISLLQLQYFCALANGESLTSTAEKLFVSQSTLSASIIKLEKEVGVTLFDRDKGKIQLNEAGTVYLRHIRAALVEIEQGRKAARRVQDEKDNHIALAASHSSIWRDLSRTFGRTTPTCTSSFSPRT